MFVWGILPNSTEQKDCKPTYNLLCRWIRTIIESLLTSHIVGVKQAYEELK